MSTSCSKKRAFALFNPLIKVLFYRHQDRKVKEADIMPYIYKEYRAGATIEIHKTYSARYGKQIPRGPNTKPTPDTVKKNNERQAEMKLRLLLNENFRKGDLFIMLTYQQTPDIVQAKKELAKFLRGLRSKYKALGKELKYICVTEYLNKRIHHHIVVNSIDPRIIQEVWSCGLVRSESLYGNDFAGLASYLIKETKKTFREPDAPSHKRWNQSKNLIMPKPIIRIIKAKQWNEKPKPRKGYKLDTDSIVNDISIFGIPYQHYRLIAIELEPKRRN